MLCNPCVIQEWWRTDANAEWRAERPGPDPFRAVSALSQVPGCGPLQACPDQAHTWHLGVGQDLCGSLVAPMAGMLVVDVFLSCMSTL